MSWGLIALAIGGFAIGTTEFFVMGLLPEIAQSLQVTIPEAGHIIAVYALGVVVGAPILTGFSGRIAPLKILMGLMGLFTLFNGLSAFAANYQQLLVLRFLAGLPHGAFFGVGAVVAARLALPGRGASAVAVMFSGLTIASVLGVPFATYIGHSWTWRVSFVWVALIGVATLLALRAWLPSISIKASTSFTADLKILKRFNLWIIIAITSIGFGGFFAWMSYLVPLLTLETGFSESAIPLLLALAGIGMTLGNWLGGRLADRISPLKALIVLLLSVTFVLSLNAVFATLSWVMMPLILLTGMLAMALCPPLQVLLIANSKGAEMLGASLGQSSFNVGNALGAYLGGIPLMLGFSYSSPQWVGAFLSLTGALIACYLFIRINKS